jgi:hypothetical protein
MVEMISVQSSTVLEVGYDTEGANLHVRFKSSPTLYIYQGVPGGVYEQLMFSASKGSFINSQIKHTYPFYIG